MSLTNRADAAAGLAGLSRLVWSVMASPDSWADLVRYRAEERWYQRLEQAENHELWLLSWLPGQRTGFHDHFGSSGAFAVARGELQELTVPAASSSRGRAVLRRAAFATGQVRAFGPQHVHEVMNVSGQPAVSIHAYAPSLAGMRRYELTPEGLVLAAVEMARENW